MAWPLRHGATTAVRLPDSMFCRIQPSSPSLSRMRRQFSNSATISTGRPLRWNTQATGCSLEGPRRTLTFSALSETKRGNGRPDGPDATCRAWPIEAVVSAVGAAAGQRIARLPNNDQADRAATARQAERQQ